MSVDVLWAAAGRPEPNWTGKARTAKPAPPLRDGVCVLTGAVGQVVDLRHVLSDGYTTWDRLPWRHMPGAGVAGGARGDGGAVAVAPRPQLNIDIRY